MVVCRLMFGKCFYIIIGGVVQLQEQKRELAKAALSGDKIKNMKLGMDDLLALFRPGRGDYDEDDEDDVRVVGRKVLEA